MQSPHLGFEALVVPLPVAACSCRVASHAQSLQVDPQFLPRVFVVLIRVVDGMHVAVVDGALGGVGERALVLFG